MPSKPELRREAKKIRASLDARTLHAANQKIRERLLTLEAVRDATIWFVYASTDDEIDTHDLIRELLLRGDVVAAPRVVGAEQMAAQCIDSFDELRLGEFGILAPPPGKAYEGPIDVCVCPGLAFSEQGHRLGSGGGYYDRFLAIHRPRLAIGLALEKFVVRELPEEPHDRKMDFVITEERVIKY